VIGIKEKQYLSILPFILKGTARAWYQANQDQFYNYDTFLQLFLSHYQSADLTSAQLNRLKTVPFNPRIDEGVEAFVIMRYNQIRELDLISSDAQICNSIIPLLPIQYQRQLASVRYNTLRDILGVVKRLEDIHEAWETRKKAGYEADGRWKEDDDARRRRARINNVQRTRESERNGGTTSASSEERTNNEDLGQREHNGEPWRRGRSWRGRWRGSYRGRNSRRGGIYTDEPRESFLSREVRRNTDSTGNNQKN
jgi:hypothetical protein